MAPARRRVSYIIPPPSTPVPRLKLPPQGAPRNGATGPLLLPHPSTNLSDDAPPQLPPHPRHRLGVSCLALDTSTQLLGRDTPEGILYTGGRDGLVLSWDLGISLKKRERRYGVPESSEMRRTVGRWEIMTGWADDIIEEETEDEEYRSDGDILGDVQDSSGRLRRRRANVLNPTEIPYEEQWETDLDLFTPGKTSQFRQSVQAHTDWVNDLLLCNYNQTVVSASSDGTVKAWSPHSTIPTDPVTIGTHADYARCLTQCRDRQWIASGSFDRTIKLWDPTRTSQSPLITLHPPSSSSLSPIPIPSSIPSSSSSNPSSSSATSTSSSSAKSSVYALAADPYGMLIASGSPERVVRMWDPRSGKRIGKLVGHTDNIRAILVSEDAKYLLTGSADASIKLWSLTTQKCLHTFTHHADSVWSLHSTHPSLEIFYSGDRSGIVCRVDVEGCTDVAEGECVVLLQDSDQHSHSSSTDGVNKIVAMDDNLVWTATGSSSVKRWRVPGRRATRLDQSQPLTTSPVHATYASADEDGYSYSAVDSPPAEHRQSQSQTRQSRQSTTSISPGPPTRRNSSRDRDREGEETWYGIPFESLVKLTSANEGGGFGSSGGGGGFGMSWRGRDPEIATLYSAASIASVPRVTAPVRSPLGSVFQQSSNTPTTNNNTNNIIPRTTSPIPSESFYRDRDRDPTIHALHTSRRASFEDRDMAQDAVPLYTTPDEVIIGDYGLVRCGLLNDRVHAVTVDLRGEVGVWDVVRGVCVGRFNREDVAEAASSECRGGSGSTDGGECDEQRSPREALDIVKERIEGEAVVATWASVDTKTGLLSVHLGERCFEAEVYADEAGFGADRHFSDEARINVGKWVLRNLFIHFIRDQHRAATKRNRDSASTDGHSQRSHRPNAPHHIDLSSTSPPDRTHARSPSDPARRSPQISKSSTIVSSSNMIPAVAPTVAPPSVRSSPLLTPMIPLASSSVRDSALSPIPQSPLSTETTPMPIPQRRPGTAENGTNGNRTSDYFSLRARRPSVSTSTPTSAVPSTPDDFSGWGTPKPGDPASAGSGVPQTPTTPGGGLMGRLKAFGKGTRRHATEGSGVVIGSQGSEVVGVNDNILPPPKTPVQTLLAGPFTPPMSNEAPTLSLPPHMSLLISEEAPSGSGWRILYRGQVSSTGQDARVLEEVMPFWLLEYLLVNKIPSVPTVKISFVLLPWKSKDSNEEPLPELLNTAQSKLTASRFLRVRKLTQHVQDKLDKLANSPTSRPTTAANTPRSSLDARSLKSVARNDSVSVRAEEQYEILCDGMVLPLDMTLAAVRQFVWRSSGELVMYYRRKAVASPGLL